MSDSPIRAKLPEGTAAAASTYSRPVGEELHLIEGGSDPPILATRVHSALRALILDQQYPCVGSRSAMHQGSYRFAMYGELASPETTEALAADLHMFVREQPDIEGEFTTFVTCYELPKVRDDVEFERLLWEQLRRLHEIDGRNHDWDPAVSSDPNDPRFSFSFGGRAFFVVGLSPASSRWARHFSWPLLAFNAHFQFEELRRNGQFGRVQEVIRERDRVIEGDANPMLEDFGDHTEGKQYAGRMSSDDWRCPVRFDR